MKKVFKKIIVTAMFTIALGAVTHVGARTFFADDYASYKAALDSIKKNNTDADTIRIVGDIVMGGLNLIDGDLTILGDTNPDGTPKYTLSGSGSVIWIDFKSHCNIENVKVTGGSGIQIGPKGGVNDYSVKIDNCVVMDNTDGIHLSSGQGTTPKKVAITNCVLFNNRDESIWVYGVKARQPEDFIIRNCVCHDNGTGIVVSYPDNLTMSDCAVYYNDHNGIEIYGNEETTQLIMVDNCESSGNGMSGFKVSSSAQGSVIISNSTAADNNGSGFSLSHCRLVGCIADHNWGVGFSDNGYAIFDKCVAVNNGGLYGFNCQNSLITNSTAANNEKGGIYGRCIINCTAAHNGSNGINTSGKIYNAITYWNGTDISNSSSLYNSVYATGSGKEKIGCSQNDPKLLGRTATDEYTDDPALTRYYTLDEGSSALGLADRSWITIENVLEALNDSWYAGVLTEGDLANILLYDQKGNVRQFSGDRYDAGAMAGIPNEKYYILSYNPARSANYGKASITFYGAGFHEQMKIALKKTGESDIIAETIDLPSAIRCDALFDFDQRSLGKWDIVFDFGDETLTIEDGFEIETYIEPEIEIDIFGPTNVRNGRWGSYTIKYSNTGNVTVYCLPVIAEITMHNDVIVEVRERWDYVYTDNVYTDKYATIDGVVHKLDTLHSFSGSDEYITFVTPIIIDIPPYGTGYLTFDMRCSVTVGVADEIIDINVYTLLPLWDPNVDLSTLKSTRASMGSGSTFSGCASAASDLLLNLAGIPAGAIPGVGCALQLAQSIHSIHRNPNSRANTGCEVGKSIVECAPDLIPGGSAVKSALKFAKAMSDARDMANNAGDLSKCAKDGKQHMGNLSSSFDPNDKCGPVSASGSTWFSGRTEFPYIINFENSSEATAPAQEVWVTDTLDLNVFDIESFEAGILKIGDKIIETPFGQQNHTWTVDMRPDMNLITKITLKLDKTKGIAIWYFKSIDPATGELPDDALAGFLPPNDDDGAGQGFVMFSIKLKEGLADDIVVANMATIVFDNNDAIVTPEWVNAKDVVPPTSAMLRPAKVTGEVELTWQGTDNESGSGIYCYDVYLKKDNGDYERIMARTTATSMMFTVAEGVTYSFYTIATDRADNRENDKINPDITLPFDNLPFDDYAVTKWNNTFMLNLRKLREDGYTITACHWFKNGEPIGDDFAYSAGPTTDDKLETGAIYYFQLTTDDGNDLYSTNKIIGEQHSNKLRVYPNPVPQGNRLTVEGVGQGDLVEVYNYMGVCVSRAVATGNVVELMPTAPTGVYVVRANNESVKVVIK